MEQKGIRTNCRFCGRQCHILADLDEKGKVCKIRPDSEHGTVWCATGRNGWNLMNHPERIRMPLRRVGEKGVNQWEEIGWEEAFAEIGRKCRQAVDMYGSNSFLGIRGFNKPYFNPIYERFMNTIGTVNSMGAANMCHMASMSAARETFGFMPDGKITDKTKFLVLWGANPYNTSKAFAAEIQNACRRGTKLIVIDPCNTKHAQKADLWLPIKPGTDLALAMGMMQIVLERKWYDAAFIEKCTYGFDKLQEVVKEYPLEKVTEITGLTSAQIEEAARMIAQEGPGIIEIGNAMDHNLDGFQKSRAINMLAAITGNVDCEGAIIGRKPMSKRQMEQRKKIARPEICPYNDPEKRKQIVGYQEQYLDNFNESGGAALAETINTGKPYPIKTVYVQGGNPAMIWENREELVKAFCKLDFMVVSDFFMTPTAMLADIILPASVYMEYESIWIDENDNIYYCPNLVPEATTKSDLEIINEMAKAMGYKKEFWDSMDSYWNDYLEPFGVTLEEVREKKVIPSNKESEPLNYGEFRENGFPTASGKINLYSDRLKEKGLDPIPVYYDYAKTTKEYPYLSTNYKSEHFYHTAGRMIKEQREKEPEAIVFVSKDIADEKALEEGDMIFVTTEAGSVRQKVHIDDKMSSGTVALAHGWWYPEKEKTPFVLEACSNNIVYSNRLIGKELPSFTTRGLPCDVKKCLKYEEIYPENAEKSYEVRIVFVSTKDYLQKVQMLKEKGFLEGNPEFVLDDSCTEKEKLIRALKSDGYVVKLRTSGKENPGEYGTECDRIIFCISEYGENFHEVEEKNMKYLVRKIREKGFEQRCEVEYRMEQKNMYARHVVRKLAEEMGIAFHTVFVSFGDDKKLDYLSLRMPTHEIIKEAKKYFFNFLDEIEENEAALYNKYMGREPVILNAEGELQSEWKVDGEGNLALISVEDYRAWRNWNRKVFEEMTRKPEAGLWWLWKRSE